MKHLAALAALLAAPALSGCGFTPLYATDGPTGVATQLNQVNFAKLEGPANASRHFHETFADALKSTATATSRYQLTVNLTERHRSIAVTASADTRRFNYSLTGNYVLRDLTTDERRRKRLDVVTSYGVVSSQYASLVGREDAERRAAEELARKIELDIALHLKGRAPKNEGVVLPAVFGEELIEGGVIDTPRAPTSDE